MTFADLVSGDSIFVDANTFVYWLTRHSTFGPACKQLVDRIERKELSGVSSAHVLSEVAHKVMVLEAAHRFGWPLAGMASRLKRYPAEVQKLTLYRQAIDEISLLGMTITPVTGALVSRAADITQQTGLLAADALVVAVMRDPVDARALLAVAIFLMASDTIPDYHVCVGASPRPRHAAGPCHRDGPSRHGW